MPGSDWFVRRPRVMTSDECQMLATRVYEARADWTPCFDGVQFTLGRAYYTHLEEGRAPEYFAAAGASDALVERALPGLQARVRTLLAELVCGPVIPRSAWCGPGVHIFPAGDWLAHNGGDIHFDTEGLGDDADAARLPALSAILMLQPPVRGGGLRLWDARWDGGDDADEPALAARVPSTVVDYAAGDLVVIDSYRLHQIQPFNGDRDRISVTAHLIWSDGTWHCWF